MHHLRSHLHTGGCYVLRTVGSQLPDLPSLFPAPIRRAALSLFRIPHCITAIYPNGPRLMP
jgi:hypothetical protein